MGALLACRKLVKSDRTSICLLLFHLRSHGRIADGDLPLRLFGDGCLNLFA